MNDFYYERSAPDPDGPRRVQADPETGIAWTWTDYEIEQYILKENPDGLPRVTFLPNGRQIPNDWVFNALRRSERKQS